MNTKVSALREGGIYDGCNAHFSQIVNTISGFIIAVDNVSPSHKASALKDPELKFWPDVMFLQWTSCASTTSKLKYVQRYNVANTLIAAAVDQINRDNKTMTGKWPGITYQADSKEGRVLVDMPNGSGVAYLLI